MLIVLKVNEFDLTAVALVPTIFGGNRNKLPSVRIGRRVYQDRCHSPVAILKRMDL